MVARVIQGVVKDGRMDEVIKMMDEVLAPNARDLPGSKGLLLLTHAGSGQAISITLWESADSLLESETSGFLDQQIAQVLPFLEEAPSARTFDVASQH